MNPKQFLQIGGVILLVLGIAGAVGIFSKTNTPWFWLDNGENVAHIVLGVVALAASFVLKDANAQKWLVALVGILGIFSAVFGYAVLSGGEPNAGFTNLEGSDDILHLVVGAWALAAAFVRRPAMATRTA